MKSSKRGLEALSLFVLAALSLMAFTATGAHATSLPGLSTPGEYQINLTSALLATIHGKQSEVASLLVQGRNLTVDCEAGLLTNGKINHLADASVTLLFEKCVVWNHALTKELPCTVKSTGEGAGSIAVTALAFPTLHGGKNYVLFEPPEGATNLSLVEFHGAECPLPLSNPLKGSFTAEVTLNDMVKPVLIFSGAIQELTGDKMTLGSFEAFIKGLYQIELTGAHAGMKLAVF